MRATLTLDEELVETARRLSGITTMAGLVHAGLKALIARESARRLAALGGSEPALGSARRRRLRQI